MVRTKKASTPTQLDAIFKRYEVDSGSLMPILQDIQKANHYLSENNLKTVATHLGIPLNQVYAVATFYNAFSLVPKGKYIIQVCAGTACHIKGAGRLLDELTLQLKIKDGETTKDSLFSIESVRCLGCCSLAPVIMVNGKTFGNLKPDNIKTIIKDYKKKK